MNQYYFLLILKQKKDEQLVIDYVITYPMSNNKKSTKVFKIKKLLMNETTKVLIKKKHPFRVMTTKKLYSGEYNLEIQINGKEFGSIKFFITV